MNFTNNAASNVINDCENLIDLTPTEPAPRSSWTLNPFDAAYQIEEYVVDNATPEIKEVISDLADANNTVYSVHDLNFLTQEIKHNQLAYIKDGIALYTIRTKKLYRQKYRTFNEYCQAEIGRSGFLCRYKINAARITLVLIAAGFTKLPLNAAQAYALFGLDNDEIVEAWHKVLDTYQLHEITSQKIKTLIYPPEASDVLKGYSVDVPPSTMSKLVTGALKFKLSVSNYIDNLIETQKCKFFILLNIANYVT